MFRFSFLALLSLLCALPVQARPVARQMPFLQAMGGPDYISFSQVDNTIDCQLMNGAFFAGNFTSEEAIIEVDSNVGLQISYEGGDLKSGPNSIPTTLEFSVLGQASFDGRFAPDSGPMAYTEFGKVNQKGVIEFPTEMIASMPVISKKGLKARVVAERRGLQDHAGQYTTQVVLSWAKF